MNDFKIKLEDVVLIKSILQKIIDFAEKSYEECSHTYIESYRVSRSNYKHMQEFAIELAKKHGIKVKVKRLTCQYDNN